MQIEVKLKLKIGLWEEEIYRGQTPQNVKLKLFLQKNSKTSTPPILTLSDLVKKLGYTTEFFTDFLYANEKSLMLCNFS